MFTCRRAYSRLLGGFAGGFGSKGCAAPAFPQVGNIDIARHPPKTAQKSGTMAKSALISCKTAQKSRGADADKAAAAISASADAPRNPYRACPREQGDGSALREKLAFRRIVS